MMQRIQAARRVVQSLRFGEKAAAERVVPHLADDVTFRCGDELVAGKAAVLERVTGQWPLTPVLSRGGWSEPRERGEEWVSEAEFPDMGAAPKRAEVSFRFNPDHQIADIRLDLTYPPSVVLPEMSLAMQGVIGSALFNGTPIVVSYVDSDGWPALSLRGSVQVLTPTRLCMWVRKTDSGLAAAIPRNPHVSLLYRDSRNRTTLIIRGKGWIGADESLRSRVYELAPEVEQNHDPERRGAALVIDVRDIRGTMPSGSVLVRCADDSAP